MAKILHSGDWHIDKTVGRISLVEDHEAVFAEMIRMVREQKPDLFINAGDLFQGARPSTEGMRLAFNVLQEIAVTCPVVIVRGNHDSESLFSLFEQIVGENSRIHFVARVKSPGEGGILNFETPGGRQRIRLATLPFVHANRVVGDKVFGPTSDWMGAYAEHVGRLERMLEMGLRVNRDVGRDVELFAAHLHVAGAQWSGSERPAHVSEAYGLLPASIPSAGYAAFGHLHKPQALPGGVVGRFAGSPMQLDFGEEGEKKGVVLIEINPGEGPEIEILPIESGRRLRRISGTLDQVAKEAGGVTNEILRVVVETEEHNPHLSEQVADMMPNATIQEVLEDCAQNRLVVLDVEKFEEAAEPHFTDLFEEFLRREGTRGAKADLVLSSFSSILNAVEEEGRVQFPEEAALGVCCSEGIEVEPAFGVDTSGKLKATQPRAVKTIKGADK